MNQEIVDEKKKMILDFMNEKGYHPMKLKELCYMLQVTSLEKPILQELLQELLEDGLIEQTKRGKYQLTSARLYRGIFESTSRGFGFVRVDGLERDIFIPETKTGGAFHTDEVLVEAEKADDRGKKMEGSVLKILRRGMKTLVGTFEKHKGGGFVIPDNQKIPSDIYVPKEGSKGALTGHKVVVKLTSYGKKGKNPEGIVTEILGYANEPGTDILSVVKGYGLPVSFPPEVREEAQEIPGELEPEDYQGRLDLRGLPTVTIDGEDARDLDDAVTLSRDGEGYHLGVHIADVSHYVKENSPLDREARKRGTSVYLLDRVIPMLPQELSNGICSLNAGCDRLALSCLMDIDETGKLVGHRIVDTVIRVDERMTYQAVNEIISEKKKNTMKKYEELVPLFLLMGELSGLLRERRRKRGSIDFDFPESKIILDENGHPLEIKAYERNAATRLIEDFMLMANETVAEDYFWQEIPFVYRTHETPDSDRIHRLNAMIQGFGYVLKTGQEHIHPKEIQKLLAQIEGTPEEPLISRLALRSMKQARYTTQNVGHFGLSASCYCHFTSPIRRYPDLQIHRIMKEAMGGGLKKERQEALEEMLPKVADQCSRLERRAEEAEREVVKRKKAEYMEDKLGKCYRGAISGATGGGFFVELENTVEGMVPIYSLLDDFYYYDEEKYAIIGREYGRQFSLGQPVEVVVAGVDILSGKIYFQLEEFCELPENFSAGVEEYGKIGSSEVDFQQ